MKKYKSILMIVLLFAGCSDIFEENISSSKVIIIYPDSTSVVHSNITLFQWEPVKNADYYQLQIFSANNQRLLDSANIETQQINFPLNSGSYSWRIKAYNSAYTTEFTNFINFKVEIPVDLTNQNVVLDTPSDHFYFNNPDDILLTWLNLSAATSYNIRIDKETSGGITTILQLNGVIDNMYIPNQSLFDVDASYYWMIQGVNSISQTPYSQRVFYLDRIPPLKPVLTNPNNNSTLSTLTINFEWNLSNDTGQIRSPINYKFEIADNENFNQILYRTDTNNLELNYTFQQPGIYYWRVKAYDLAGNESDYSDIYHFTIN